MARQKRQRASTSPEVGADPSAEAPPAKVLRRSARVRSITEAAEAKTAIVTPDVHAVTEGAEGDEHKEELLPPPPQQQQRQPGAVAQQQGGPLTQEPQTRQTRAAAAATPSPKVKAEPAASQEPATQEADQQDSEVVSEPEPEESEPESEEEPPSPKKPAPGQKGKKAAKKAAKPKKERKKKTPTRRICLSAAMAQYGLSRKEMDALTDVHLEPNPHHARGAPMRLYLAHQVAELAAKKQERLRYEADHADEIAAAREEEARQRREAAKQAARAKVELLKRPAAGDTVPAGNTPLPQELWAMVFQWLAATLEPQGGVRGPSVVAEDIVLAGLACRDMFIASRAGLEALAEEVAAKRHLDMQREPAWLRAAGAGLGVDWDRWDKLLRTPMSCKVTELRSACKEMGEMVSGTKAELVVRLMIVMNRFGLPDGRRCPVPLRLWLALQQERNNSYGRPSPKINTQIALALKDLSEAGHLTATGALGCVSLVKLYVFRRLLAKAFGDTAGLMAAHRACLPRLAEIRAERARRAAEERGGFGERLLRRAEEQRQILQERWQQAYRRQQELHELRAAGQGQGQGQDQGQGAGAPHSPEEVNNAERRLLPGGRPPQCACGSTASPYCTLLLCGQCCRRATKMEPCPRHD